MKETTAPKKAPSPVKKRPTVPPVSNEDDPRRMFIVAAANMSWQLAVVVLVPIVGGFKLDEAIHTLPVFTILGFVVAMASMAIVVKRHLDAIVLSKDGDKKNK